MAEIIGAHVLNIAKQDYIPQGASVTVLVSEGPVVEVPEESYDESPGPLPENVNLQLDKSHITVIRIRNSIPMRNQHLPGRYRRVNLREISP